MATATRAETYRIQAGQIRNAQNRRGEMWRPRMLDSMGKPSWEVRLAFPYDPAKHSKNKSFYIRRVGKRAAIGRSDATHGGKNEMALTIAQALVEQRCRVVRAKLYVGFFLQKLNWQSDAHNLVDIGMDSVAMATEINDRWYVLMETDWEMIVGARPMFYVYLCQFAHEDEDFCSYCGAILPESELRITSKYRICAGCES